MIFGHTILFSVDVRKKDCPSGIPAAGQRIAGSASLSEAYEGRSPSAPFAPKNHPIEEGWKPEADCPSVSASDLPA